MSWKRTVGSCVDVYSCSDVGGSAKISDLCRPLRWSGMGESLVAPVCVAALGVGLVDTDECWFCSHGPGTGSTLSFDTPSSFVAHLCPSPVTHLTLRALVMYPVSHEPRWPVITVLSRCQTPALLKYQEGTKGERLGFLGKPSMAWNPIVPSCQGWWSLSHGRRSSSLSCPVKQGP